MKDNDDKELEYEKMATLGAAISLEIVEQLKEVCDNISKTVKTYKDVVGASGISVAIGMNVAGKKVVHGLFGSKKGIRLILDDFNECYEKYREDKE